MVRFVIFAFAIPALAVFPSEEAGSFLTLYREPKLVAFAVVIWIWLAVLAWGDSARGVLRELPQSLLSWPVGLALGWTAYMSLTSWWGAVSENAIYELRSLVPASILMLVLVAWQAAEPKAADALRSSMSLGLALVTGIAALQWWGSLEFLPPIHPELGGRHASTFGFKNPAALAVLGQWFLVVYWALSEKRRVFQTIAVGLAGAEGLYIASLHSRTALLAMIGGLLFLFAAGTLRAGKHRLSLVIASCLASIALVATVASVDSWRQRALLAWQYVEDPRAYLESDRGTYLLNTLAMVESHPLGVGLGDWQTYYPVFRRHRRDFAFDHQVEVRRAHSDHVQIFGEGGWPGLTLWWGLLGTLLVGGLRAWKRSGDLWALCLTAQLVTWSLAMATDYVIEMPFHRFQFFIIVALAIGSQRARAQAPPGPTPEADEGSFMLSKRSRKLLAALLALAAVTEAVRGGLLLSRVRSEAVMTRLYAAALSPDGSSQPEQLLGQALRVGQRFSRLPGYTKTTPRAERVLAHIYWLTDQRDPAFEWLRLSLEHQPYSPVGMGLAAEMLASSHPDLADDWLRASEYVRSEASEGFKIPQPEWPKP